LRCTLKDAGLHLRGEWFRYDRKILRDALIITAKRFPAYAVVRLYAEELRDLRRPIKKLRRYDKYQTRERTENQRDT